MSQSESVAAAGRRYATFTALGQPLALPLEQLAGVVAPGPLQPLPHAAAWVLGVTAWRGRAITVIDLARLVGAGSGTAGKWLMLEWQGQWLAVAVSEVGAIITATPEPGEAALLPAELAPLCAAGPLIGTPQCAELQVAALFAALAATSPFRRDRSE